MIWVYGFSVAGRVWGRVVCVCLPVLYCVGRFVVLWHWFAVFALCWLVVGLTLVMVGGLDMLFVLA